jgi:hypothetical protein
MSEEFFSTSFDMHQNLDSAAGAIIGDGLREEAAGRQELPHMPPGYGGRPYGHRSCGVQHLSLLGLRFDHQHHAPATRQRKVAAKLECLAAWIFDLGQALSAPCVP